MNKKFKNGISLVILIITIVVMVILAGAVIMSLSGNNPITQASKFAFKSDVKSFTNELNTYNSNQIMDGPKGYSPSMLQADENSITYDRIKDTNKSINDVIPLLGTLSKYDGLFEVIDGKLVFIGTDTNKQDWSEEVGIGVIIVGEPQVTITATGSTVVQAGTDIVYTLEFSSDVGLTNIDLVNKLQIVPDTGTVLNAQPTFVIGSLSGTETDNIRSVDVTIKTDTLLNGSYKLKVKADSAINENNITNKQDTTALTSFTIEDNIAPTNPIILANPTGWTNGNVSLTITYSTDSSIKKYSTNGVNWSNYTSPITVSTNNTTIYAKGIDAAGNQSGQSTLTVASIDKILPIVTYGTNGGSSGIASTTVTVSDTGGSLLNIPTLQYAWDTQNTITPTSGWITFTNGGIITNDNTSGTYYLWVKATDNAGNNIVSKTNMFTVVQLVVANAPVLATGMTAKKWNGSSWDTVASPSTDTTWYNYANSQWANAQTADGSMWVWIPRYVYKISSLWHTASAATGGIVDIQFTKGTNDEWNSSVIGALNTGTGSSASNNTWTNHPAFTFGTTELEGIWVAKFEASNSSTKIKVVPNIASWRSISVGTAFTTCRSMETDSIYGWGTSGTGIDTHMMKNTEWGAVAYLAQSVYGTHGIQVWSNSSRDNTLSIDTFVTGTATEAESPYSLSITNLYPYDNLTYGVNTSTTKNVYGVYDMSGGAYEYTAAYSYSTDNNLTTNGNSLVTALAKYKDVYTGTTDTDVNDYANSSTKKGDAMYETSSSYIGATGWFADNSYMPNTTTPFFLRGGVVGNGPSNGIFTFWDGGGSTYSIIGFRPVLAVSAGI